MSKYNNKLKVVDGITFDSVMEANYYEHLKELRERKQIVDFGIQPVYELQPKFYKRGKTFLPIKYKADFEILKLDGEVLTIDVKGFETADFKIKKKMFEYKYPQELRLVTFSKIDGGWIEMEALKIARKRRKLQKDIDKLDQDINRLEISKLQAKLNKLTNTN